MRFTTDFHYIFSHSAQKQSQDCSFQSKMPQLAGKRFMQLKHFGYNTLTLSMIIVCIEQIASRNWSQHWFRISILHILFILLSDPDYNAYAGKADLNNGFWRIWYSVTSYVLSICVLSMQWICNLVYIIQLISGDSTDIRWKY